MPSVAVPSSFFVSERNSVYGNWRTAFWRELLSNALDAGANHVRIRSRFEGDQLVLDTIDNGSGMSRQTVEAVYMRLGASTKSGQDGIGGFGRARILTCFSQDSYRIRSEDYIVTGQGASYEIQGAASRVKGCAVSVRMPAREAYAIYAGLQTVLRQSSLRATVNVRLDINAPEGIYPARMDEANFAEADGDGWRRFRGWSRLGRHFDSLADEKGAWADLFVNEGDRALKNTAVIRVNGMAMYEDYIATPAQVTVNLVPGRAREVLTASRDAIRAPFRDLLQELYQRIGSERLSAFRGKPREPETDLRTTEHTVGADGHPMPAKARPRPAAPESPEGSGCVERPTPQRMSAEPGGMARRSLEGQGTIRYGLLYPVAIHVGDPHPAQRAVVGRYGGETWMLPGNEGRNAEILHGAWTAACRHALSALAEIRPDLIRDDARWVTGFVFDREMRACHMPICGIAHGLLLNPVDAAGRTRFKLSDPASMKTLIAEAIHEVSHVAGSRHDEFFASNMTNLVAAIRDRDIEREIRIEADRMREWQRFRQEAIETAIAKALELGDGDRPAEAWAPQGDVTPGPQ